MPVGAGERAGVWIESERELIFAVYQKRPKPQPTVRDELWNCDRRLETQLQSWAGSAERARQAR